MATTKSKSPTKSVDVTKNGPLVANVSAERWQEIKTKYPHFPTEILELTSKRQETLFRLPAFVEDWVLKNTDLIHDPRDAIMLSLIVNITIFFVPLYYVLWKYPSHWLGFFVVVYGFFTWAIRFVLMKHYAEHRKVFGTYLNWYVTGVLGTLFGIPPGLYGTFVCPSIIGMV